jgi:DNA-binding MarR family transcriptional regulator
MTNVPTTRISYTVKRLESALRAHLDVICREFGVTTTQYTVLSVLRVHPGLSSAQLAVRSFVSPQSANQMVAVLENAELIKRAPDEVNRRILRARLTPEGQRILEACDSTVHGLEALMFTGLSDADLTRLRRALNQCIQNLSGANNSPVRHARTPLE